jgi:hypothetical protein
MSATNVAIPPFFHLFVVITNGKIASLTTTLLPMTYKYLKPTRSDLP